MEKKKEEGKEGGKKSNGEEKVRKRSSTLSIITSIVSRAQGGRKSRVAQKISEGEKGKNAFVRASLPRRWGKKKKETRSPGKGRDAEDPFFYIWIVNGREKEKKG